MSFKDYVENSQVEKKLFAKTDSYKYKIRRSIAAFANSNGGKILIGAADAKHDGNSIHQPVEGLPEGLEIGTWLDSVLSSAQLIVPAPVVDIELITHDGRSYALLSVKKAVLPIGVRKEVDVPLEYNKRGNQSIVPFSFEDFVESFNTQKEREARVAYAAIWMVLNSVENLPAITQRIRDDKTSVTLYMKSYDILFSNYGALLSFAKTQHDLNDINRLVVVTRAIEESLDFHNGRAGKNIVLGNHDEAVDQIEILTKEARELAFKISKLIIRESSDVKNMLNAWLKEDPEYDKKIEKNKKDQPEADSVKTHS